MSQNRSSAVMQQRSEPHDSLDDFPTLPFATRALTEHVLKPNMTKPLAQCSVWEPACNRGYMVKPLREAFAKVIASDIFNYGWNYQQHVVDFLYPGCDRILNGDIPDFCITNPPFRLAQQFIHRSFELGIPNIAMIVRSAFLEGIERYFSLYRDCPPSIVAQFVERVPMIKGRIDRKASTATSYCWLVWIDGLAPQPFTWIPPCRRQLERDSDYE